MKEKWQTLNQREQHLVIVMSLFIGIFILYSAIWQPINDSIDEKKANIKRYQELLVWAFMQGKDYEKAFRQARALDRKLEENGMRVFYYQIMHSNKSESPQVRYKYPQYWFQ